MPVQATVSLPPDDEEAERRLLAGLLREPERVGLACLERGVCGSDLYHHAHRLVWEACWQLIGAGLESGAAAVYVALRAAGHLADLPRPAGLWLAELLDADPTGMWHADAIRRVLRASVRRRVIRRASEVLRDARDGVSPTADYERQLAAMGRTL